MFSSYGSYGLHANNCGTYLYHFWQHKKILKANDLPTDLNVHSLRHTAASLFIASGTDVGTVAGYIRSCAKMDGQINTDMQEHIVGRLIESLLKFRFDR